MGLGFVWVRVGVVGLRSRLGSWGLWRWEEVEWRAAVREPSLVEVLTAWSGVGQENGDFNAE
jgi:hypothetical protein